MGFKDDMEQYDEEWAEAQEQERGGILPDGPYQARVTECRVEEGDSGYSWVIKFEDTAGASGSVRAWRNLDHEVGRSIAAQDAKILGYVGPLSGLEEACGSGMFDDLVVEIKVVSKPNPQDAARSFTNVYVNRLLRDSDGAAIRQAEFVPVPVPADDDIPF